MFNLFRLIKIESNLLSFFFKILIVKRFDIIKCHGIKKAFLLELSVLSSILNWLP